MCVLSTKDSKRAWYISILLVAHHCLSTTLLFHPSPDQENSQEQQLFFIHKPVNHLGNQYQDHSQSCKENQGDKKSPGGAGTAHGGGGSQDQQQSQINIKQDKVTLQQQVFRQQIKHSICS
jgi:hypothetical protein